MITSTELKQRSVATLHRLREGLETVLGYIVGFIVLIAPLGVLQEVGTKLTFAQFIVLGGSGLFWAITFLWFILCVAENLHWSWKGLVFLVVFSYGWQAAYTVQQWANCDQRWSYVNASWSWLSVLNVQRKYIAAHWNEPVGANTQQSGRAFLRSET